MPEYHARCQTTTRDPIVRAYLECAEWCGLDDDSREAFELSISPRWTPESQAEAEILCAAFRAEFCLYCDIESEQRAGHDLWLTRNRHGAGFWDGGWPEPFASRATAWAHAYGEAFVEFDPITDTLKIV
jgi:hypothetical protein